MGTEDKAQENLLKSFGAEERIKELCDIILVYSDSLDFGKAKAYIKEHISNEIEFKEDKYRIRDLVQRKVIDYIDNCRMPSQLFAFGSDSGLYKFRKDFKLFYEELEKDLQSDEKERVGCPIQFEYIFDFIQETIDFHALHDKFSINLMSQIKEDVTKDAIETVEITAKVAMKEANESINKALMDSEKQIEKQVEEQIKDQMPGVNKNISETSVTILGMFSGIVLAIVTGLFYSSSVLESVSNAEIYRLLAVASIVGLVSFDLITLMFMYINKIRGKDENTKPALYGFVAGVNVLLVIIMTVALCKAPKEIQSPNDESNPTYKEDIDIINEIELG